MRLVYVFSACLIVGMFFSQIFDLAPYHSLFAFVTNTALSYIMIEVGLDFKLDKKHWKNYVKDYIVAAFAATLPWIFCFLYLLAFFDSPWEELLLIARFAAPTSSGILFSMLAAAGLATTWLFRKVQVLAILDDVDTIILMVPLQFLILESNYQLFGIIFVVVALLFIAWRYLHRVRLPTGRLYLLGYGIGISLISALVRQSWDVELEVLLPAFVLGCVLINPHNAANSSKYEHEHAYLEPEETPWMIFDRVIKIIFMLFVGLLLPNIDLGSMSIWIIGIHVLLVTILINLGKCVPLFFYREEASLRERAGVSIGMFPRGEVGAGILVLALEHGVKGCAITVSALSLALNLLLTGVFIAIVIRLINGIRPRPS